MTKFKLGLLAFYLLSTIHVKGQVFRGGYTTHEGYKTIRVSFSDSSFQTPWSIDQTKYKLIRPEHNKNKVAFGVSTASRNLQFNLTLSNDKFIGTCTDGNNSFPVQLYLTQANLTETDRAPYLGHYKTESGDYFRFWDRYNFFRVHSPKTESISGIYTVGAHKFIDNEGELYEFLELGEDGFQRLKIISPDGQTALASRSIPYEQSEVKVQSGDLTLSGTLFMPKGIQKAPASVILPGGGGLDRQNYLMEAEAFASYGIASIVCDKRGTGGSEGTHLNASFEDLTKDAVAIYEFMKTQPGIDPEKIGFRGPSQGGRIAIMAANRVDAAYAISAAAPITTMKDGQLYAINQNVRLAGYPEEINAKTVYIWHQYYDQILAGQIEQSLVDQISELREIYPNLYLPPASTQLPQGINPNDIEDDALDHTANISCPVLYTFGDADERVPVHLSSRRLRQSLEKKGVQFSEIAYPGANHSFMQPGFRVARGYLMDQIKWIKRVVK